MHESPRTVLDDGTASTRFRAIGTTAQVRVTDPALLADAAAILARQVDEIDLAASRFRDDSELARINAADGRPVEVGPLLVDALRIALRVARDTSGDVDPTVGGAMVALGWDRDFSRMETRTGAGNPSGTSPPHVRAVRVPGWRRVEFDAAARRVRVPRGVQLDLGATAKAFAADRAAVTIHAELGCGVLVNLGGDIACSGPAPDGAWRIRITDAHDAPDDLRAPTVLVADGGIASSSTRVRRWRGQLAPSREARELHHIVDPSTGLPASDELQLVSVAAPTCTEANAASTAAIIRGLRAPAWLEQIHLPARIVTRDGEVIRVAGWPEDGLDDDHHETVGKARVS